jgi:hypothetical protein
MGRRSKEQRNEVAHPYAAYEGSEIWQVLERAVDALVKNGDIKELTARRYIVGYLAHSVVTVETKTGKRTERSG